jgi:hypothetical protein
VIAAEARDQALHLRGTQQQEQQQQQTGMGPRAASSRAAALLLGLLALCACVVAAAGLGVSSVFPQAAPAPWNGCACDGSSEDPQLVGNLLEQLSTSTEKFIGCRQQLLRQKYHVPIIIGNPLGDSNSTPWQALSGVLAVACAVLAVLAWRSRTAHAKLQQHVQHREAAWRQAIIALHGKAQERDQAWLKKQAAWQHKEAEWQQGVQQVAELVLQREVALTGQSPAAAVLQASASKVCMGLLGLLFVPSA